jgi:hypothetical protein
MKTIKELIDVLSKFPLDAKCHAYEGEACGISISWIGADNGIRSGFIECSEREDTPKKSDKTCSTCASKQYCGSIPIERNFPDCWNADKIGDKI